MLYEEPIND